MEVIEAAILYMDVLSFQDIRNPALHLKEWHEKNGNPVLLADGPGIAFGEGTYKHTDGVWYAEQLKSLINNPGCVGFHLCGAYQRNKARDRGLLDEYEQPDVENVEIIKGTYFMIYHWMKERVQNKN